MQFLLGTVRREIRRQEALDALDVAEDELRRIVGIASAMARQYGVDSIAMCELRVEESVGVASGR